MCYSSSTRLASAPRESTLLDFSCRAPPCSCIASGAAFASGVIGRYPCSLSCDLNFFSGTPSSWAVIYFRITTCFWAYAFKLCWCLIFIFSYYHHCHPCTIHSRLVITMINTSLKGPHRFVLQKICASSLLSYCQSSWWIWNSIKH